MKIGDVVWVIWRGDPLRLTINDPWIGKKYGWPQYFGGTDDEGCTTWQFDPKDVMTEIKCKGECMDRLLRNIKSCEKKLKSYKEKLKKWQA